MATQTKALNILNDYVLSAPSFDSTLRDHGFGALHVRK